MLIERDNSVCDPYIDFALVLGSQSRNQSVLNFITFLERRNMPMFQEKPSFFSGTRFKRKLPYIGDIVKWHVHNFLLNNITA